MYVAPVRHLYRATRAAARASNARDIPPCPSIRATQMTPLAAGALAPIAEQTTKAPRPFGPPRRRTGPPAYPASGIGPAAGHYRRGPPSPPALPWASPTRLSLLSQSTADDNRPSPPHRPSLLAAGPAPGCTGRWRSVQFPAAWREGGVDDKRPLAPLLAGDCPPLRPDPPRTRHRRRRSAVCSPPPTPMGPIPRPGWCEGTASGGCGEQTAFRTASYPLFTHIICVPTFPSGPPHPQPTASSPSPAGPAPRPQTRPPPSRPAVRLRR